MEDEWLKLKVKAAYAGWTSRLPLDVYGAWCKLLQVVKAFGVTGVVTVTDVTDHLTRLNVAPRYLKKILEAAGDNITVKDGVLCVVNWEEHQARQEHNTNAERQRRYRERKKVTGSNVTQCNARNVTPIRREEKRTEENQESEALGVTPTTEEIPPNNDPPFDIILAAYNSVCPLKGLPKASWTKGRREHAKARWKEHLFRESLREIFAKTAGSSFLTGHSDRRWKADFGWIIKSEENYVKILEGKYSDPGPDKDGVGFDPNEPGGRDLTEQELAEWKSDPKIVAQTQDLIDRGALKPIPVSI